MKNKLFKVVSTLMIALTLSVSIYATINNIPNKEGIPDSFTEQVTTQPESIDIDIEVWDQRQDATMFQAGYLNNGFEQGLVSEKLVDGFPVANDNSNATYPSNAFNQSMFKRWWSGIRSSEDFSNHNGWEKSSLPKSLTTDESAYVVYEGADWANQFNNLVSTPGYYDFTKGQYFPGQHNHNEKVDGEEVEGHLWFYDVRKDNPLTIDYPVWYDEPDNMNDTRSDDRDEKRFLCQDGQVNKYGNTITNCTKPGEYPLNNFFLQHGKFYSAKKQTVAENKSLDGAKGKLTLDYDETKKVYTYDSNKIDSEKSYKGFFPFNYGDNKVKLSDEDRNKALEFSKGDQTSGTKIEYNTNEFSEEDKYQKIHAVKETDKDTKNNPFNFHYTMKASSKFTYTGTGDEVFSFSGDDDVWVYIDGKLVLDIGGSHQRIMADISFGKKGTKEEGKALVSDIENDVNNQKASKSILVPATTKDLDLKVGESYDLIVFYAERQTGESNLKISTNLVHDKYKVNKKGTLNHQDQSITYDVVAVSNENKERTMTITEIADWFNEGDEYSENGQYLDFKNDIELMYSTDQKTWQKIEFNDDANPLKVTSLLASNNTKPGIDVQGQQTVYFKYVYKLSKEQAVVGNTFFNKFTVLTNHPNSNNDLNELGNSFEVTTVTKEEENNNNNNNNNNNGNNNNGNNTNNNNNTSNNQNCDKLSTSEAKQNPLCQTSDSKNKQTTNTSTNNKKATNNDNLPTTGNFSLAIVQSLVVVMLITIATLYLYRLQNSNF